MLGNAHRFAAEGEDRSSTGPPSAARAGLP